MGVLVFIRMAGESTLFTRKAGESVHMYLADWQVGVLTESYGRWEYLYLLECQVGVLVLNRMAGGSTCIESHGRWEYLYLFA